MIHAINAVLLATTDVRRLAEFYRDRVGLPLRINDHGSGLHAEADLGETHFAIFPGGSTPTAKGPVTFSLHVDDIDAEYAAMQARGVAFDGPPRPAPFGGVLASFRDPDGNGVCLMVWQSEYAGKRQTRACATVAPDPSEYAPHHAMYIGLVPAGDILNTLRRQSGDVAAFFAGLTDAQAGHRYAPGKWSLRELLGHVIDTERIFGYRALRIARGDTAPLPGFDENAFAAAARHDRCSMSSLLEEYQAVRLATLGLFGGFDADAWERRGNANGREVSVRAIAWITAGHELHHLAVARERYR